MNKTNWITASILSLQFYTVAYASVSSDLLAEYQQKGASMPNPINGKTLWNASRGERSCTTCHGENLSINGQHAKTGKLIKPMALSANPDRFTKKKKIEKWFLRNCKWTLGRECTVQEKSDILSWLGKQ